MGLQLNQRGFSLVSVLVAISLTGVLSLILMNLSEQQNKQQKKAMIDSEITEIVNNIRSIFLNNESCFATLNNKQKGNDLEEIKTKENQEIPYAIVSSKDPFRGTKIYLTSLRILTDDEVRKAEYSVDPSTVVIRAKFRKRSENNIGEKKKSEILGGSYITKYFEVRVLYGRIEGVTSIVSNGVVSKCNDLAPGSYIQDTTTKRRAIPQESGATLNSTGDYEGQCVIPDPDDPESKILECLTGN